MKKSTIFWVLIFTIFLTSCSSPEEKFIANYKAYCKSSTTPYGYSEDTAEAYCDCAFQLIVRSGMTIPQMMKADQDILLGIKSEEHQKFMDLSLEAQLSCGNLVLKGNKLSKP